MKYDTKRNRRIKNIPMHLPVNYRDVWLDRLKPIKEMMIARVTLENIAKYYNCTLGALNMAMRYHGVSAIRVRHDAAIQNTN